GRLYSYARVGKDDDRLYPLYIGYPHMIRGYESNSFESTGDIRLLDLMGPRMAIANLELRIPFTGPEKLALIKSGLLFSDLNFLLMEELHGNLVIGSNGVDRRVTKFKHYIRMRPLCLMIKVNLLWNILGNYVYLYSVPGFP